MKVDFRFFILFFTILFLYGSYSLVIPLFPLIAKKKGLSASEIGIVLSTFAIGGIILSINLNRLMSRFSKTKLLMFFQIILFLFITTYGILEKIERKILFIIACAFSRLIQGAAVSSITSIIYSLIPSLYESEYDQIKAFSYLELSGAISYAFTYGIGGILYNYLGFQGIFYLYGTIILIFSMVLYCTIKIDKEEENKEGENKEGENKEGENKEGENKEGENKEGENKEGENKEGENKERENKEVEKKYIPWCFVFKNFKFTIVYLQLCCVSIANLIYEPGLSLFLSHKYGLNVQWIGFYYSIAPLFYMSFSIIYPLIKWKTSKVYHVVISNFFLSIGLLLIGPVKFIDGSLVITTIGLMVIGFFSVFGVIPIIPVIIEILEEFTSDYSNNHRNNFSSNCYINIWFIGELMGPLLYGFLTEIFGYENGIGVFSVLMLIIFILFFIFVKKQRKKTKLLESI